MANIISVTTSPETQLKAASFLSETLHDLGCSHAYIGGFAWALLGSARPTEMNVLIEVKDHNVRAIRQKLSEASRQFAQAGLKFYFVEELRDDLAGDQLVRASKGNVLIETLQAGTLGLPKVAGPVYEYKHGSNIALHLLHPGVLILTKLNRWTMNKDLTRPKTIRKQASDSQDLHWLVQWLAENNMTIAFDDYEGKSKEYLLNLVRQYRDWFEENVDLMAMLQKAMKPNDWALL